MIAKTQPPVFEASSILLINSGAPGTTYQGGPAASDNLTLALNDVAQIQSSSVMEAVIKTYPDLKKRGFTANDLLVDVTPSTSTTASTITLLAIARKPYMAVTLANDVANGYATYLTNQAQGQLSRQRGVLQAQVATQQAQVANYSKLIAALPNTTVPQYQVYLNNLQHASSVADSLQSQLNLLPTTISGSAFVIQQATLSEVQPSPKALIIAGVTVGLGLLIGILIMLLVIFLDNRLINENQVKEKLGFAYLGGLSNSNDIQTALTSASSPLMQETSDICANLRLTGVIPNQWYAPQGVVLLVTSPRPTEGKTVTTVAMATAMAEGGNSVVIVDGNLRQPSTHLALDVPTSIGLSEVLKSNGEKIDEGVQRSKIPNVWFLAAGAEMTNSASLLEQRLPGILAQLRHKIDVILIDGPALLSGAEASIMASLADGVALVIDARHDKIPLLERTKELLNSVTHTPTGIIMNRLSARRRNRYYATAYPGSASTEQWVAIHAHNGNGTEAGSNQVAAPTAGSNLMIAAPPFIPRTPGRLIPSSSPGTPPSTPPATPPQKQ